MSEDPRAKTLTIDDARQLSSHEILQAWQDGLLTADETMELTGIETIHELLLAAHSSAVELKKSSAFPHLTVFEAAIMPFRDWKECDAYYEDLRVKAEHAKAEKQATREQILKDISADVAFHDDVVERVGSFSGHVRAHYAERVEETIVPEYSLDGLLAQTPSVAELSAEDLQWVNSPTVGDEIQEQSGPTRTVLQPTDHKVFFSVLDNPPEPTDNENAAFRPIGATPEDLARLSPVAVEACCQIFRAWKLSDAESAKLLGVEMDVWRELSTAGWAGSLTQDQLYCASVVLGIHKHLQVLGEPMWREWVKRPNSGRPFDGKTPLAFMLDGGFPAMMATRLHVEGIGGGWA